MDYRDLAVLASLAVAAQAGRTLGLLVASQIRGRRQDSAPEVLPEDPG